MAHFAELDSNNKVTRVIVVANEEITDSNGIEHEDRGIDFCRKLFGPGTTWVQCSYNHKFRKRFPGKGYTFDSEADVFIAPKPYESWTLNSDYDWEAPIPYPNDDKDYRWNEEMQDWEEVIEQLPENTE
jgi:hypothetical protein